MTLRGVEELRIEESPFEEGYQKNQKQKSDSEIRNENLKIDFEF